MAKRNVQTTDIGAGGGTLHVVLHGEIAIFETDDDEFPFSIYTPQVEEHVFMAGPWLGEQRIPSALTLELTGVVDGDDTVANYPDRFVVFQGGIANPACSVLEIRMPRPKRIWPASLNALSPDSIMLNGPSDVSLLLPEGSKFPPNIAQCSVFEYNLDNNGTVPAFVRIGGQLPATFIDWSAGQSGLNGSYSLHVYAESDAAETSDHAKTSFGLAAGILGADAELTPRQKTAGTPTPLPPFLASEEVAYTLAGRIQEMRLLTAESAAQFRLRALDRLTLPGGQTGHEDVHALNDLFTCQHCHARRVKLGTVALS